MVPPLDWETDGSSNTEYTSDSSLEIAPPSRQRGARRLLVIGASSSDDEGRPARLSPPPEVVPPPLRVPGQCSSGNFLAIVNFSS